jgi:methyl-accepting chemotaxis protein
MNPISSLNIGARLWAAFGMLIALLVLLSVLATGGLRRYGTAFEYVMDSRYGNIRAVAALSDDVGVVVLAVRNFVMLSDPDLRAQELTTLKDTRAAIDDDYKVLAARVQDEDGRQRLAALQARGEGFLKALDALLVIAAQDDRAKASELVQGELQAAQLDYMAALASFTRVQEKAMDRASGEAQARGQWLQIVLWAATAVGLLLGGLTAWWVTRSITGPLGTAVAALRELEAGNLAVQVRGGRRDEVGQMLQALTNTVQSLRVVVGRVLSGVQTVASASGEIAAGNQDLSQRTEQQASSLQKTAATMEEFSGSVRQSAEHARQADQLANAASQAASRGGEVVSQVVGTMSEISASSRRIADIIGVIDGIAFQTNILALNAAVEAARAGEQGRGFAVVASEVRGLAKRSGDAAREIKALIDESVQRVERGAHQAGEAGTAMQTIVDQVKKVSDLIGEISSASVEQSSGIGQVSEAVSQMDQVTQQNAALVEQAAAAAQSLNQQAQELADAVAVFRLQDQPDLHAAG